MRSYLEDFFERFEYDADDTSVLLNAYDRIIGCEKTRALWEQAVELYEQDIYCDFKKICEIADSAAGELYINEYTAELLILICLTRRAEREYEARGIEKRVFFDTFRDLRYKLEECKLVRGVVGTFVFWWFGRFYDLTRFAFGRLQFETVEFGESYECGGKRLAPESIVINVHIPRSLEPLDAESCDRAFAEAAEYYGDKIDGPIAFVCSSWLLYPENEKLLSPASNVYRFMKRFDIIKHSVDREWRHLWRLFDTDEKNPDRLPADTSMRRAYVEHLKSGGKIGTGKGVFFA